MNRLKYLFLFLIGFSFFNLSGQGWERYYDFTPVNQAGRQIYPTPDGGFFVKSINVDQPDVPDNRAAYLKTDFDGRVQNFRTSDCVEFVQAVNPDLGPVVGFLTAQLASGNIAALLGGNYIQQPGGSTLKLEVTDLNGNQVSCKDIPSVDFLPMDMEPTDDNNLYVCGTLAGRANVRKIDLDGNIIWQKSYPGAPNGSVMKKTSDGGVLLVSFEDAGALGNGGHFYRLDADGNEFWRNFIGGFPYNFRKPVINASGEIFFGGNYFLSGGLIEMRVFKLDNVGDEIARFTVPTDFNNSTYLFDLEVDSSGGVFIGRNFEYGNSLINRYPYGFSLEKLDADMNSVWERKYFDLDDFFNANFQEHLSAADFIRLPDGSFVITGTRKFVQVKDQIFLFKTDSLGNTWTNQICGKIALDRNNNCQIDPNEPSQNVPQILQLIQGNDTLVYSTGINGEFSIGTDSGAYELRLLSTNPLWTPCQSSFMINHSTFYDTVKVDFALEPVFDCPNLSVDIGSTRLRRCRTSTFTVNYCNEGTIDAIGSYVEVQLDPELTVISSVIPNTKIDATTWRFDIGTVELFECGFFNFNAEVVCDGSVTGRTLCAEAHIFPDTLCLPPPANWSKASLSVSGECKGNEVVFTIENIGKGDMTVDQNYIVIEDIAVMRPGSPFKLPSGEKIDIPVAANGSTVRLEVPQPDYHPYGGRASATVEFCGNPPFTTGLFNQLGHNKNNPAIKTYCARVLNGYDPNEKLASPTGFRDKLEIRPDQELDYEIHFQNTGNDTAFRVVLLDTLSANVDLKTLRVGASSHLYEWDMFGERILRFTFENINLVDSFTNVIGSQGFVRYSIDPKPGLAVATEIRNAADIYFDFNPPIYTNQSLHTIGFEDFDGDGVAATDDCDDENVDIGASSPEIPNNDIDEDCDGIALIIDDDGDGFNSDEDCDDNNAAINPNAFEIPNNDVDENCDGTLLVVDADGDGFNSDEDCDDSNASINTAATEIPNNDIDEDCDGVALIIDADGDGFNSDEDCDDTNASINSGATEIPNNDIDEDCDGVALVIDVDMDGFNSDEDCDDNNAAINPNALEIPNNDVDENCDGTLLVVDADGDGFNSDEDCDDTNAAINTDATEIPNNDIDEDCDGIALMIDADGDGFNSDEDCDDSNAAINTDATEIPNNDIDEDCDGIAQIIDVDMDGSNSDEDCDDSNAAINPNATEIPNNDIDEDCDGIAQIIDVDMDGFNSDEDCDDTNAAINPDAMEIPNNDIDEDCNGSALIIDNDMDGFNSDEDCDDEDAAINPDAVEIPNNDIDEDCNGSALIIDNDMDGFNSDEDCDDENAAINPNATEIPDNGIDEDCDGADATSGTEELFLKTLKIYPNPASEFISIQFDEFLKNDLKVQILDVSGKSIKTDLIKEGGQFLKIKVQDFSEGIHFVRLTGGEHVRVEKIFISGR